MARVRYRAALGQGVVLLALHGLSLAVTPSSTRTPTSAEQARLRLDPNVATREELMLLPRIGPALAENIIEYRESLPAEVAFRRLEDLENVHRIGPVTAGRLRSLLRFPSTDGETNKEEDATR